MNQLEAMRETVELAARRGMMDFDFSTVFSVSYEHLLDMYKRACSTPDMSETKLGRWLGWMQAAVTAAGFMTLDEAKEINKRWSGETKAPTQSCVASDADKYINALIQIALNAHSDPSDTKMAMDTLNWHDLSDRTQVVESDGSVDIGSADIESAQDLHSANLAIKALTSEVASLKEAAKFANRVAGARFGQFAQSAKRVHELEEELEAARQEILDLRNSVTPDSTILAALVEILRNDADRNVVLVKELPNSPDVATLESRIRSLNAAANQLEKFMVTSELKSRIATLEGQLNGRDGGTRDRRSTPDAGQADRKSNSV